MFKVYVPKPDSFLSIKEGSGVVGQTDIGEDRVLVYYEGNLYGAVNLVTYPQRVHQAASRAVERYPTTAVMAPKKDLLIEIGEYDYETDTLNIHDQETLSHWLGED